MSYYDKKSYQPKKPVKSFQDLEVYQKSLATAVTLNKRIQHPSADIAGDVEKPSQTEIYGKITQNLLSSALAIPVALATAHSRRFGDPAQAIEKLEQAMLLCNLSVVYLEEYRDLVNGDIEHEFFEEQIKACLAVRGKILRLQRSWRKFMAESLASA